MNMSWLDERASKLFWGLFALHVLCWTIIPTLTQPNAPLDVIEGLAWGNEWVLGTYKHPPLQAWLLQLATYPFGRSGLGYFGLAALCGGVTLWAVYRTGRLFVSKGKALLAALLTQSIFYVSILAIEFNPNTLQLALGAVTGYAFAHALHTNKLKYWLLLGVTTALGFYAKYSFALFPAIYVLYMLLTPTVRARLLSWKVLLALALGLGLLAPHLYWLATHDFIPFAYAASRAELAQHWWQHLFFPFKFLSAQMLAMGLSLALGALLLKPQKNSTPASPLLGWLAFGPLALLLLASAITGDKPRDMWGMPFLTFIPLWAIATFQLREPVLRLFSHGWAGGFVLTMLIFVGGMVAPHYGAKPMRGHFPGADLSAYMHQQWQKEIGQPLEYVVGDAWLAGNVAFYGPARTTRPHVWIDGAANTSQWIHYDNVKKSGAIVVWRMHNMYHVAPPAWAAELPGLHVQIPVLLPWKLSTWWPVTPHAEPEPVLIGWAIVPPIPSHAIRIQ